MPQVRDLVAQKARLILQYESMHSILSNLTKAVRVHPVIAPTELALDIPPIISHLVILKSLYFVVVYDIL